MSRLRARDVPAQAFEPVPVVGGHAHVGVQAEAVGPGAPLAVARGRGGARAVSEAGDAPTGARAEGDVALDGGGVAAGQGGGVLGGGVGGGAFVVRELAPALKEPLDAPPDGLDEHRDVVVRRRGGGVEGGGGEREDAVQHQAMIVDVEIEAATEALDDGDRAASSVLDALSYGGPPQPPEESS